MRENVVGVDVGGTFTDFIFMDTAGHLTVRKRPSTPADPSESVAQGLHAALSAGELLPDFTLLHGTTVATNALLERRGAKTALLTTLGFRDVLAIGRQERRELYALHPSRVPSLLPREMCFEVSERMDWRGSVVTPLNEAAAVLILDELRAEGIESLAVCFLFSYLNPAHEQRIGTLARERGFDVSLSCEIAPEPREYERAATTAANAFVTPVLRRYLTKLEGEAQAEGADSLRIMQSNGGTLSAREAAAQAVKTALSGPAGGVVAAMELGRSLGLSRLLTFDMGGTSTDVALIADGKCPVVTTGGLGGLPLRPPLLDIHTVGAGGGSLARQDAAGGLRVGPQSAGANPGPVAYGTGEILTVTDANARLGRLPAMTRLGGEKLLDTGRVAEYFDAFADRLSVSAEAAAYGVLQVANAAMARALRHVSVERGHDPADFALVSFGGAGGLHACDLADALQMRSVLVPRFPGAFSALGLALAPVRRETVRAFPALLLNDREMEILPEILSQLRREMQAQIDREMDADGLPPNDWNGTFALDLRYTGQSFALQVEFSENDSLSSLRQAFHRAHQTRYGYASAGEKVEAVAARFTAVERNTRSMQKIGLSDIPAIPFAAAGVYFDTGWQETPLYYREELALNQTISGPALFLQSDATTLLLPNWQAKTEPFGTIEMVKTGE